MFNSIIIDYIYANIIIITVFRKISLVNVADVCGIIV